MKKNTIQIKNIRNVVAFSFISAFSFGQVGIGNTNPKSSLDVTGVPTSATTADGIIAPRLSRANLIAKTSYNGTDHRGTIVYVTDLTGTTNAQTVNVTQVGYYYLDNNGVWQRFATGNGIGNIYTTDGTLTGDRTISTGAYSLTIDGGTPTYDKVNMANGVFSLDDVNDRIGIKTTTPTSTLDVAGFPGSPSQVDGITAPRLTRAQLSAKTNYSGLNNRGAMVYVTDASGTTNAQTVNVQSIGYYYLDNSGVWQKFETRNIYTQDGTLTGDRTISTGAYSLTIDGGTPTYDKVNMANGVFSLDDVNDRIGIKTTTPTSTLDVAGNPSSPSQVDGITAPRLTRANLIAKTGYTGANNKGAIVYVTDLTGTTNAQTVNVTQVGYYYLDNNGVWQRFVTDNSIDNIYTTNGTLTSDRTISTGAYSLTIDGGTPTVDKVNIANGLFSVDDVNDRIGIKTTTPTTTLDVVGFAASISQADGIRAPRLTRANLSAKTVYTGTNHRGAIVYVTDLSGTTNAQTINVTQIGYYYLDNNGIWQRFVTDNSIDNIYTTNGALTSDRTISTNGYRLSINSGSPMLDKVNMDNGTFSLDALNNRIGIGTTSPQAKLHVVGGNVNTDVFKIQNQTTTLNLELRNQFSPATMGSGAVNYSANGENVFCVFDLQGVQGNLVFGEHIGPYNSGDYDIGRSYGRWRTIYLTNSPNVSSDKRLKSNLKPISNATNLIMSLTPLNYDKYKTFEKTGEFVNEFGFIAQDLKKVVPQAVTGNENDENPMGVQYEMLIPILTKAIQEQQEVISSLEMRIKALEESKK